MALHKAESGDRVIDQERFLPPLQKFSHCLILKFEHDRPKAFGVQLVLHIRLQLQCILHRGEEAEEQDQGGRGISLAADIEPGIVLEGDPFLISRVIVNLLENARKYGKENGHIWARLSAEGGYAVLEVKDDGIGIDPEHIDKIWQRFYQVNPSRKGNSGLGLGLSMVWQIVSLHKGTVKVKSEPGKGSCFTVSLPLHSAS